MHQFLLFIDSLSTWIGKMFAWLILVLTLSMTYEVFVRYALNAPTTWAFDFSYISYGALFLMAGAYTLARNAHVRGDFLYRKWQPRTQATLDLVLYVLFFLPGVLALVYSGWKFAAFSIQFQEKSIFSPAGIPVFPLKTLIPVTGVFLLIQGVGVVGACWRPQVAALARHYQTLFFDNRGIGESTAGHGSVRIEAMAEDARALMDEAGWDSAHVMGHSMGGVIAQQLALDCPKRVRSLSLLCTFARGRDA